MFVVSVKFRLDLHSKSATPEIEVKSTLAVCCAPLDFYYDKNPNNVTGDLRLLQYWVDVANSGRT